MASPLGIRAHYTRSVAFSRVLIRGAPLHDFVLHQAGSLQTHSTS